MSGVGDVWSVPGRAASRAVSAATGAVEGTARYAGRVTALLATAEELADRAQVLLDRVDALLDRTETLLADVEPVTRAVAPPARQVLEGLTEQDVEDTTRILSELPGMLARMERTALPALERLDDVGPNVQALRERMEELCDLMLALPGMSRLRRHDLRRSRAERADGGAADSPAPESRDESPPSRRE